MNCSTRGLPVHHQLLEFTQTHAHRVSDAIQPSHSPSSPSPPTPIPPSIRVFSNESTLRMRWPKYLIANRSGHKGNRNRFLFLWVPKSLHCDWSHEIKRHLLLGGKAMANLDNICNQRHHFAGKGPYNQGMVFPSSRAWMWDLNHTEGWMPNNWCFRTVVLENTLESLELQRDQTSQS